MAIQKFRFGLRYKIILVIVAGVFLMESVSTVIDYYSNKQLLLRELQHQQNVLTAELNQTLVDFSVAMPSSAKDVLSSEAPVHHLAQTLIASDKSLLSIVTYQERDGMFADGRILGGNSSYPNPTRDRLSLLTALDTGQPTHYTDQVGSTVLFKTFVPIRLPSGTHYVDEFITDYKKAVQLEIQRQLQRSVWVSIGTLLLAILSAYGLAWYIANPLLRLQRHIGTMKSIESAAPLHLQRNDEIGDLAENVNEMAARLFMDFNRAIHDERSSSMKYMGMVAHALIHELRSSAVAGRNLLKLLPAMQVFTPQARETLTHITTSVDHMNSVIDNFGRVLREGSPLEIANHDVVEIVQQAIGIFAPLAHQRGTVITMDGSPGLNMARVDAVSLRRVILNLLKNGLDAMEVKRRDGEMKVRISTHLHRVRIDVTDQGSGIPRDRWTEVFMPFKSSKEDGFGLGLALSAMLIIGMGGNIFVKESSSSGTVMRITLPAMDVSGTRNDALLKEERIETRT